MKSLFNGLDGGQSKNSKICERNVLVSIRDLHQSKKLVVLDLVPASSSDVNKVRKLVVF